MFPLSSIDGPGAAVRPKASRFAMAVGAADLAGAVRAAPHRAACAAVLPISSGTAAAVGPGPEATGTGLPLGLPLAGLGASLLERYDGWNGPKHFAESIVMSRATMLLSKKVVDKERPDGECCRSFSSRHRSAAFAVATSIRRRWGLPAYAGATLVDYSRAPSGKRPSDPVAAGAAIGAASSFHCTDPYLPLAVSALQQGGYRGVLVSLHR
jgi:hypothetical protein